MPNPVIDQQIQQMKSAGYTEAEISDKLFENPEVKANFPKYGWTKFEDLHGYVTKKSAEIPKQVSGNTWAEKLGIQNSIGKGLLDLEEGKAAGISRTIFNTEDMVRRALGAERKINEPRRQQAMAVPPSTAGTLGNLWEGIGEYAVPGTAVGKAVAKAPLLGRMAAEGLTSAGVAGLQTGGDTASMAGMGVMGALGPVAGVARNLLKGGKNALLDIAEGAVMWKAGAKSAGAHRFAKAIEKLLPDTKVKELERAAEAANKSEVFARNTKQGVSAGHSMLNRGLAQQRAQAVAEKAAARRTARPGPKAPIPEIRYNPKPKPASATQTPAPPIRYNPKLPTSSLLTPTTKPPALQRTSEEARKLIQEKLAPTSRRGMTKIPNADKINRGTGGRFTKKD